MPVLFSFPIEDIDIEVASLASELHCKNSENLTISISTINNYHHVSQIFSIIQNELIFTSIMARNHCTAVHSFRTLKDLDLLTDAQKILDEAYRLWIPEISHTDFASGRFLGLVSENLNILHVAIDVIASSDAWNVFNILRNIGNALPFLININMNDLAGLAAAQHSKTLGDFAAGIFFDQVSNYLSAHPMYAKELYTLVRKNIAADENKNLYRAALIGMAMAGQANQATEIALNDAGSDSIDISVTALWVLGYMLVHLEKEPNLKGRLQTILKKMACHTDSNIRLQALEALSNCAVLQPELVAELLAHAKPKDQEALQVLSKFIFMNLAVIQNHPHLTDILYALTDLNVERTHYFDYMLSQLIKNGNYDKKICATLEGWLIKHPISIEDGSWITRFEQSVRALENNKTLLSELITRWLVSDEQLLGHAFMEVTSHLWGHSVNKLVFSKDIIDTLNYEDIKYLVRRLLGWTCFEEPLISLAFSLLDTKDAQNRTFEWVYELLVNAIGRNYLQGTLEAIKEKLNNATPEIVVLLQKTEKELLAYADTIQKLPNRIELYPPIPMRIRRTIALKKEKELRDAVEKANEQCTLQQLFTKVPLKAGTGNFSIFANKISVINRLGSHSLSYTLPAQFVIDPLNDEITRSMYRFAKRGDE